MTEQYISIFKWVWLLICGICLTFPVFIPSHSISGSVPSGDVMGAAAGVIFMLSFPSSVLWAVALAFGREASGWHIYSIGDMYVNLFFLCVLGYIQWFYVVPKIFQKREPQLQLLELHAGDTVTLLEEGLINMDFSFFASESRTPLERVIDEAEQR